MKVTYQNSLTYKMLQRIQALPGNVVLRADVADMAARRQVSYALTQLINNKQLVRLGYGIYAKAHPSKYINAAILEGGGFEVVVSEVLDRLNISWEPSKAVREYNSRRSTQIPVRSLLQLKSRFRRSLNYGNLTFSPSR